VLPRKTYELILPSGRKLCLGARTLIMGVLNVTPDSFSDGGQFTDPGRAAQAALEMVAAGADVIDIGGESTRPGAGRISVEEERARVTPVLEALGGQIGVPVSIDTSRAEVARAALDLGATIINDVSGLRHDPGLARVAADGRVPIILMHSRGTPANMSGLASYGSVVDDVASELAQSIEVALAAGVRRDAIAIDPGLGFAKQAGQSLDVIASLDAAPLRALDRPLVVGPSRKSFLASAIGTTAPGDRDWATSAAVTAAILQGAHMLRVHRVKEMVPVALVADAIRARRG
jgi:dihydropteroate synthase